MPKSESDRRSLPAAHRVLSALGDYSPLPRAICVRRAREALNEQRRSGRILALDDTVNRLRNELDALRRSRIQSVINATGVPLHTNLGRAPLAFPPDGAFAAASSSYTNLEFDLSTGERGRRGAYVEEAIATYCGAEGAVVVNNCAAGLVLTLRELIEPDRPEVLVSRGELIQIGGGFRIPEILETSGATLREVGTTNRTTVDDYRRALDARTALILKVHWSNFAMSGFVEAPTLAELAGLARETEIPLAHDLGSGALVDTATFSHTHEPTPKDSVAAGADLTLFSGDKLLGGPQCGLIIGSVPLTTRLRKNPLYRALRCDKLILGALQDVTERYMADEPEAPRAVEMMRSPIEALRERALRMVHGLAESGVHVEATQLLGEPGGGTLPETQLRSTGIAITPKRSKPLDWVRALRESTPPVIARIEKNRPVLDLRTVFPNEDATVIATLRTAAATLETP